MQPHSILIPHDGSALSGKVVDALAPLLGKGVNVTFLHVFEDLVSATSPSVHPVELVPSGTSADDADFGSALSGSEAAAKALGATVVRVERRASDVAAAIVDDALESRPELVAMTTHGQGGISRFVRGSVAERVLRACPVPLLMVNPHSQTPTRLARMLVALDGSKESEQILEVVIPLAKRAGARVTVLYVDWAAPTDTPSQAAKRRAQREEDVRDWLAAPIAQLERERMTFGVEIVQGDVAEQIVRAADPEHFDLLAISTHGRSGLGRWLLGSIAEKVLSACRIPILLVRAR